MQKYTFNGIQGIPGKEGFVEKRHMEIRKKDIKEYTYYKYDEDKVIDER